MDGQNAATSFSYIRLQIYCINNIYSCLINLPRVLKIIRHKNDQ